MRYDDDKNVNSFGIYNNIHLYACIYFFFKISNSLFEYCKVGCIYNAKKL